MHPAKDVVRLLTRHRRLVTAVFDERGKNIRDGQYSYDIADAFGAKRVGISATVKEFVMMPDCIKNFRRNFLRCP